MTLIVKPAGRGFRLTTSLQITGGHMDRPIAFKRGQQLTVGGVVYRIVEVHL